MKVIRSAEKHHEERGAAAHEALVEQIKDAAKTRAAIHDEAVAATRAAHEAHVTDYKETCERIDAKHDEQVALYEEYEAARKELDVKIAKVRKKLPSPLPFPPPLWVCDLLNIPRDPLPEKPVPEHPGYPPEPMPVADPVPPEEPAVPEPTHLMASVWEARQVEATEENAAGVMVETPWGEARAMPGCWIVEGGDGAHIVADDDFRRHYTPSG